MTRLRSLAIALALLPLLSGCVAVVAIPLAVGGGLMMREQAQVRAATRVEAPGSYAGLPAPAPVPPGGAEPVAVLTELTELPAPTATDFAADPWQAFADFALAQAARLPEANAPQSVLLSTRGLSALPEQRPCTARFPAVIIDLDAAKTPFAPALGARPSAGLAPALAQLRAAKIVVLWLTDQPASRVGGVASALRDAGLDPEGKDQYLLIRGPTDRKQVLREEANTDVCVIAIAGDVRSDFDELFDYLRDPSSAGIYDGLIGSGWFIEPLPLAAP